MERGNKKSIVDVTIRRGAEIYSDHLLLLVANIKDVLKVEKDGET